MSGQAIATAFVEIKADPATGASFESDLKKHVAPAADAAGKHGGTRMGVGFKSAFGGAMTGVFAGGIAANLLSQVSGFASDTVDKFQEVGKQTLALQRVIGGSAEDASRMVAVFKMTGVADATKPLGLLSRHLAANDKAWKSAGVSARDANGNMRPMTAIVADLAAKFAKMPNGPEKSALAMKLFGRGGLAMLPTLNKGAAGIKALTEESDKLGTTLSGKDLDAVKENTKAKRLFGAALEGLQMTVGRYLLPVFTKLITMLTTYLLPVFQMIAAFIANTIAPIFAQWQQVIYTVAAAIGEKLQPIIMAVFGYLQTLWKMLMDNKEVFVVIGAVILAALVPSFVAWVAATWANVTAHLALAAATIAAYAPIILIGVAIGAFILLLVKLWQNNETFRTVVLAVWNAVKTAVLAFVSWFLATAWPIIQRVIGFIVAYYTTLWNVVSAVFGWILGKIGGFVSWFLTTFGPTIATVAGTVGTVITGIWTVVSRVVGWITDKFATVGGAVSSAFSGIGSIISTAFDGVKGFINTLIIDPVNVLIRGFNMLPGPDIGEIPHLAAGGTMLGDGLAMVGERGPEVVRLPRGATVYPHGGMPSGGPSGGVTVYVDARGADAATAARFAATARTIAEDVLAGVLREAAAS